MMLSLVVVVIIEVHDDSDGKIMAKQKVIKITMTCDLGGGPHNPKTPKDCCGPKGPQGPMGSVASVL